MKLKLFKDKEIKNIIFDLGNVVLDIDISLTMREFENIGIGGLKIEDIHPHQKDFFLALEVGTISNDDFLIELRKTYPIKGEVSDAQIWGAWNKLLLEFNPKRIELIKNLSSQYNIYLLSNTNHPHRVFFLEKFEREFGYPFESLFKKCYYSDVMKLRKPDPKIYA